MDIIVPNLKRYSDGEIDRAFMKEIQNGFKLEKQTEKKRVAQAAKEANKLKHSFPSAGGFARHYKGSDPRSRYNR